MHKSDLPEPSAKTDTLPEPKVSVISIALKAEEFERLEEMLSRQTYRDFEFVGEAGGAIPVAWNRALRRARGQIVVFTETDATAVDERWLEEMVAGVSDEKTIAKGLEVRSLAWDLNNLAGRRSIFVEHPFDETFSPAADIELLSRLKQEGYHLVQLPQAPVIYMNKDAAKHYFRRAFQYGLQWARLSNRYAQPVELSTVPLAAKMFRAALLNLLGLLIGWIIYLPERFQRKTP